MRAAAVPSSSGKPFTSSLKQPSTHGLFWPAFFPRKKSFTHHSRSDSLVKSLRHRPHQIRSDQIRSA